MVSMPAAAAMQKHARSKAWCIDRADANGAVCSCPAKRRGPDETWATVYVEGGLACARRGSAEQGDAQGSCPCVAGRGAGRGRGGGGRGTLRVFAACSEPSSLHTPLAAHSEHAGVVVQRGGKGVAAAGRGGGDVVCGSARFAARNHTTRSRTPRQRGVWGVGTTRTKRGRQSVVRPKRERGEMLPSGLVRGRAQRVVAARCPAPR